MDLIQAWLFLDSNSKSPALEDLSVQKSEISSHIDSTGKSTLHSTCK